MRISLHVDVLRLLKERPIDRETDSMVTTSQSTILDSCASAETTSSKLASDLPAELSLFPELFPKSVHPTTTNKIFSLPVKRSGPIGGL